MAVYGMTKIFAPTRPKSKQIIRVTAGRIWVEKSGKDENLWNWPHPVPVN